MNMGFLDILGELTEVDLSPSEAGRAHSNIMTEMNGQTWVAIDDNVVIGTVSIHILPKFVHRRGHVGVIEDAVVSESRRSKGIGRELMDYAISYAIEKNCYKIILNCALKNIPFYEQCGFQTSEYQMRMNL